MRKILVISSLLVMIMFLVSCAPQMTDEELEAELAKLTPEEREALLKDLEIEKGAFAGQAVAKYTSKLAGVPKAKLQTALKKLPACTDSDGGDVTNVKGITKYLSTGNFTDFCYFRAVNISDLIDGTNSSQYDVKVQNCDDIKLGKPFQGQIFSSVSWASPCQVREYVCVSHVNISLNHKCPYGCSDGACYLFSEDLS